MSTAVGVLLYVFVAFLVGLCGRRRRLGVVGFFIAALLLTPPVTLLIIWITQPRPSTRPPSLRSTG